MNTTKPPKSITDTDTSERIAFDEWNRKDLAIAGLVIILSGIGFAGTSDRRLAPLIDENVFNGLLVAISIFIAYISVIIIFYLGKNDEFEKEYLTTISNYLTNQREVLKSMRRVFKIFLTSDRKTRFGEETMEGLRTELVDFEKDRFTTKDRDEDLERFRLFRSTTIRWGIFSLVMHLIGLFLCIAALLFALRVR